MNTKVGPFTVSHRVGMDETKELSQLQKLYVAAMKDDLPTLHILSEEEVDFQLRDDKMRTLLHLAHRAETIAFLIECGCDPLALDSEGSTTLMHPELEAKANQLLLECGVDIHARDRYGAITLYRQCDFSGIGWENPDLDALQVLLEAGVANGNEEEIERIIEVALQCATSAGENNDVSILADFLRKYKHT